MMQDNRRNYYFPSIAKYVKIWLRHCEAWKQDKRISNMKKEPELLKVPEWDLGLEDAMQIHLLPELPHGGGYENNFTAIDLFSRYAFAYPVSDSIAVNQAEVKIDILTRHACLPTLVITKKDRYSVLKSLLRKQQYWA